MVTIVPALASPFSELKRGIRRVVDEAERFAVELRGARDRFEQIDDRFEAEMER